MFDLLNSRTKRIQEERIQEERIQEERIQEERIQEERSPNVKHEVIRPQRRDSLRLPVPSEKELNTAPLPYRYIEVSLLHLLDELTGDSERPFSSKYTKATNISTGTKELITQYYFQSNTVEIKSEGSSLREFETKKLFSIKGDVTIVEFKGIVIDYLNSTDKRRKHLNLPSVDSCGDINRLKALLGTPAPKYVISPRKTPLPQREIGSLRSKTPSVTNVISYESILKNEEAITNVISYESILKNEEAILNLLQDKLIITTDGTWEEPQRFRVRVEGNKPPLDLPSILMEIRKLSGRKGMELHLFFASPLPFWTDLKALLLNINQLLVSEGLGYVIPGIPFQGTFLSLRFTTHRKEQERILELLNSN